MSINKIFPCDLCKKTFGRNGDLTRHKAIHSGEKNHMCDVCGMRFAQHSGLKTHQNTHTGEKPHKCGYCHKAFGDPSSCTRHEKEKHEAKPFQCYWCPSSIVRRSSFTNHVRTKHPQFRHLVTKDYLDAIEGPRRTKPRSKRGRKSRSATPPPVPDARVLSKVVSEPAGYYSRCVMKVDDEIVAPRYATVDMSLGVGKVEEIAVVDSKAGLECTRQTADALWPLALGTQDFVTPYADREGFAQQQHVPQYSQQVYQHQYRQRQQPLEMLNWSFGLPMYDNSPRFDVLDVDGSTSGRGTRSLSSSPMPATPQEVKPATAYFVEPSKVNSYDFPLYGTDEQQQYVAPPVYSYVPEEQQGLLYLGF